MELKIIKSDSVDKNKFESVGTAKDLSIRTRFGDFPDHNLLVNWGLSTKAVRVPTKIASSSERHLGTNCLLAAFEIHFCVVSAGAKKPFCVSAHFKITYGLY